MGFITRTLGDICDEVKGVIQTGPFGSQLHQSDYQDQGTPVIMPKDILDGKIATEDIAYIGDHNVERLSRHRLQKGDIIYARRGDIGRRALITDREAGWICGTGCIRISLGDSTVDPVFLHYYLGQPGITAWIYNQAIGATMPNLNTSIIRSISVSYPPLPTQRKIAAVLSAYDDLIENNMRRIALLEEMARLLYREWFVRFRFPGHESVRLVDSPLGEIPEGWEVRRFTEVADVLSGGTPRTSVPEYWGGEIAWFTPKDIPDTFYVLDTERKITGLGLSKCNSQLYPADTAFITARGTVGRCVLAAVPMAMSQTSYALLGRECIPQYFIYLLTLSLVDVFKQNATGAVFDTIVVDTFRNQYVAVPPSELLLKFSEAVAPIFSQIKNLQRRRDVLRRTRDLLLPRLVSGALDVAGLEIVVGD